MSIISAYYSVEVLELYHICKRYISCRIPYSGIWWLNLWGGVTISNHVLTRLHPPHL